jgi:hypothetical protein
MEVQNLQTNTLGIAIPSNAKGTNSYSPRQKSLLGQQVTNSELGMNHIYER